MSGCRCGRPHDARPAGGPATGSALPAPGACASKDGQQLDHRIQSDLANALLYQTDRRDFPVEWRTGTSAHGPAVRRRVAPSALWRASTRHPPGQRLPARHPPRGTSTCRSLLARGAWRWRRRRGGRGLHSGRGGGGSPCTQKAVSRRRPEKKRTESQLVPTLVIFPLVLIELSARFPPPHTRTSQTLSSPPRSCPPPRPPCTPPWFGCSLWWPWRPRR